MAKKKNQNRVKQNTAQKQVQSVSATLPEHMSAEEIQHIIAKAIVEAENIKVQNRKKQEIEWRQKVGFKKCKNCFVDFFNDFCVLFKLLFHPKKYVKGDAVLTGLLITIIRLFFIFVGSLLFLGSVLLIIYIILNLLVFSNALSWDKYVLFVILAFSAFILSLMFFAANFEVDKIEDRNYIFGLFASITSLISIVIAIIAFIKGA